MSNSVRHVVEHKIYLKIVTTFTLVARLVERHKVTQGKSSITLQLCFGVACNGGDNQHGNTKWFPPHCFLRAPGRGWCEDKSWATVFSWRSAAVFCGRLSSFPARKGTGKLTVSLFIYVRWMMHGNCTQVCLPHTVCNTSIPALVSCTATCLHPS